MGKGRKTEKIFQKIINVLQLYKHSVHKIKLSPTLYLALGYAEPLLLRVSNNDTDSQTF